MSDLGQARRSTLLDAAWRTAYRVGFPLARIWWRLRLAIFVLNLFLGWTLLGWVGALVWAATAVRHRDRYDAVSKSFS